VSSSSSSVGNKDRQESKRQRVNSIAINLYDYQD